MAQRSDLGWCLMTSWTPCSKQKSTGDALTVLLHAPEVVPLVSILEQLEMLVRGGSLSQPLLHAPLFLFLLWHHMLFQSVHPPLCLVFPSHLSFPAMFIMPCIN